MRVARPVVLSPEQKEALEQCARARARSVRVVERARIVLLAASGKQDKEIAAAVNITAHKAARWRNRFLDLGMTGLEKDAPRAQYFRDQGEACNSQDHAGEACECHPLVHPHDGGSRGP